jgi:ankyrin repeat protein
MSDKHFVWKRSEHMKLHTLALVGALCAFGVSAEAQTCGVLCDEGFWKSASEAEVKAEISKADVNARDKDGLTALMLAALYGTAENVKVLM